MTVAPILKTFPAARVGGPAACWVENEPLPGFVERGIQSVIDGGASLGAAL